MQSTEYLVVLAVVGRVRGRERASLHRALQDRPSSDVDTAVASLEQTGVVAVKGARVYASPALKLLNELDLIAV
ncbi:MAG: hypothetical protein ACYDHN_14860 [Solirubrobacteraceae bacterium]